MKEERGTNDPLLFFFSKKILINLVLNLKGGGYLKRWRVSIEIGV